MALSESTRPGTFALNAPLSSGAVQQRRTAVRTRCTTVVSAPSRPLDIRTPGSHRGTLRLECEREKANSRAGDCDQPHKGQLPTKADGVITPPLRSRNRCHTP